MACAPCGDVPMMARDPCPNNPCALPVIADVMPKYQVNPCQPHTCNPPGSCNVCVPMVTPCPQPVLFPRKRCKYIQPPRPKSYAPERCYIPPAAKMEDNTIYRKSYLPGEGERPFAIVPENNLCVGEGRISNDTVHRMSYLPHCAKPPCAIIPCAHKLLGEGPMQDITTNKHDYVPKPFSKTCAVIPAINLCTSDCPLSDKTVNRLSYLPVAISKSAPVYPIDAMEKPCGRISDKTVHNMSYQHWEPQKPVDTPWADKAPYRPPVSRMEDNTVHRMSYIPPGMYIECPPGDPDCIECPADPCKPDPNHFRRDPRCCLPCCCPRAAC